MGVYGNMMAHFPEQYRPFIYFDMTPGINSGYTVDQSFPPQPLWGILQNSTSMVKDSNGHIVDVNHENLWTESKLIRGKFVQFDEIIYRIVDGSDWPTEGGFYSYTLDRLVGDNGSPDSTDYTTGIGGNPI